jgi:UDP-N-acetylglucosamine transferase subunit ALG13
VDDIGPAQFGDLVDGCDVVIGHGGLGTALTALRMGRYPILVPRRRAHGEHVDDHQQELVRALHAHQLALKREADEIVPEDLTVAAARRVTRSEPATSHAAEPDR